MKQISVGAKVIRVDGLLKVTGKASYTTDYIAKVAYAVIFKSTIAAGEIDSIDCSRAEKLKGVLKVITHLNATKLRAEGNKPGFLQDAKIYYFGQHIGVVIAETFEQATYAASQIKVSYHKTPARTNFETLSDNPEVPSGEEGNDFSIGDFKRVYQNSGEKIDQYYITPIEHHHPMEPHATIAEMKDGVLTLHNPSQMVNSVQESAAAIFGLSKNDVRVLSPFIGGGFGSKAGELPGNVVLAAMAAIQLARPVKLVITRQQMFNSVGLRQQNIQRIRISSTAEGKLTALSHEIITHTALKNQFIEPCGSGSKMIYDVDNILISYRIVPMHVISPTWQRAPGYSSGSFALESGMDELAYKLKIDPVEFRLRNEPAKDPSDGKPWSSRSIVECLKTGRDKFGWSERNLEPGMDLRGDFYVGSGVACGSYPAHMWDSSALVRIFRKDENVRVEIELAASDLGTGNQTILTQIAADALNLPISQVIVKIGDSNYAPAAGSVASVGAASNGSGVHAACKNLVRQLSEKAHQKFSASPDVFKLMKDVGLDVFEAKGDARQGPEAAQYSSYSFNATFTEVWVNKFTGMVEIKKMVIVTGAGRILNPMTARSQVYGGAVWGIGMALTEESCLDPRWGNFITRSFADYHIPSNLDIGDIESIFVDEKEIVLNELGVKGIGEIAMVGVSASIANAVFNATGKRIRSLPITPDKLL